MSDAVLQRDGAKGKAVIILHTHHDKLWEMGRRAEPPEPEKAGESGESEKGQSNLNSGEPRIGREARDSAEAISLEERMEKVDLNEQEHGEGEENHQDTVTLTPEGDSPFFYQYIITEELFLFLFHRGIRPINDITHPSHPHIARVPPFLLVSNPRFNPLQRIHPPLPALFYKFGLNLNHPNRHQTLLIQKPLSVLTRSRERRAPQTQKHRRRRRQWRWRWWGRSTSTRRRNSIDASARRCA